MKKYSKLLLILTGILPNIYLVKGQDHMEELKIVNDKLNSSIYNKNLRPSSVVDIYIILNLIQVIS
jgi:hypothetical protein